jgi:hypothetical protein
VALKKYWFEFEFAPDEEMVLQLAFGCGVTAESPQAAVELVMARVFPDRPLPRLRRVLEGVQVDSLDPEYVLPFVGDHKRKGIWFPPFAAARRKAGK